MIQFRAKLLASLATTAVYAFLLNIIATESSSLSLVTAQPLENLKESTLWRDFNTGNTTKPVPGKARDTKVYVPTNYESIFASSRGAASLLEWVGGRIPNFKLDRSHWALSDDHAFAEVHLLDRRRKRVVMTIQVPKPTFEEMAALKTLNSFNRYRPPALAVAAQQKIKIRGIEADYFRGEDGACSILIPIVHKGIINLSVEKCIESRMMFDAAEALDIERLNMKLNS